MHIKSGQRQYPQKHSIIVERSLKSSILVYYFYICKHFVFLFRFFYLKKHIFTFFFNILCQAYVDGA